jgi:putative tricarboxylic transport membrane protein
MSTIGTIFNSFALLADPLLLITLMLGFGVGVIFGSIPGLTATLAIVLLLPMTYSMSMNAALFMCMGIYMAGMYAGSITAITINIPGAPSAAMTGLDGHEMMKQGKGAQALGHATLASAIGGTIGVLLLIAVSPLAMKLALLIRTPGKSSLILFAFIVIASLDGKRWKKSAFMIILGLALATVGMGVVRPTERFTFGSITLLDGFDFVPVIIGSFAIAELLTQSTVSNADFKKMSDEASGLKIKRREFLPPLAEVKAVGFWRYLKSALIGYFIGVLPGAGGSMGAFVSYAEGKRSSKHPELYGTGHYEGIACAEAANNAVCGGALVPMLTFGIPGDGVTAIVLGVLMVYGVIPGPEILSKQLYLIAPMYAALLFAAVVMVPLSLFLFGPYYIKIVKINRLVLYSSIAAISLTGAFAATYTVFQMFVALGVGLLVYFLRAQKYPAVPFILAVLLGPLFEEYFRRVLSISRNNPLIFFTQLDSLVFLVLAVFFVIFLNRFNKQIAN